MMRGLLGVIMLTGIYSLLSAGLFVVLDAVDVAFTEAAVGAGITTVLLLGTRALIGPDNSPRAHAPWIPLVVTGVTGMALIYATLDMPRFGDPQAPSQLHVAPRYINESPTEVGPPNMVTSVLASYRGYDTLGEVAVIFTAGVGAMLLLGSGRSRRTRDSTSAAESESES